ncbi:hypothetical protein FA10DRAFT_270625 [Acaromyces ingoldii]|uniref:phosphoinositide 5-phosphatase n=1 Tax=Acaromyces ingoldii TaxID=215250 RepID=A0A316YVS8_9BASI|nr:hypothetical protein FA10DRAFT_270625 [Acaromyces ingoldii]PWN93379.1 hypothetical protein FA10DRAFT_270625 [Acaromyces ingoldii]
MQVYLRESPRAIFLLSSTSSDHYPPSVGGEQPRGSNGSDRPGKSALLLSTQSGASSSSTSSSRAVVEAVAAKDVPPTQTMKRLAPKAHGCLGLINVGSDLFVAIVTSAVGVGEIRPGEAVSKVVSVSFFCLNKSSWDDDNALNLVDEDGSGPLDPQGLPPPSQDLSASPSAPILEHPCTSIKKLLGTGTFYYAKDGAFDLSRRLEKRIAGTTKARRRPPPPPSGQAAAELSATSPKQTSVADPWKYDDRFVWNSYMLEPLLEFRSRLETPERQALDAEGFFVLAIQGYVGISALPSQDSSGPAIVSLVSRLSWKRAGTRYNTRGIDDSGNVANFVESETLFHLGAVTFSHTQVRGSVPLFWEQQGLQAFNARIQVTRPRIASQPAYDRHFADLFSHYNRVHALNLLGTRDAETVLSAAYAEHMRNSNAVELYLASLSATEAAEAEEGEKAENGQDEDDVDRMGLTNFDFHATSRAKGGIDGVRSELKYLGPVQLKRKAFGFSVHRADATDSLDRTNVIEDMLSQSALELFIEENMEKNASFESFSSFSSPIWSHHRNLWAENGDALSKIYAGTGALNTTYTRSGGGKKTLGGLLSDAAKSASRMYINNFQDKSKQTVIDALLGNLANQKPVTVFDPLHDAVTAELHDRLDEYSTPRQVSVFVGTWNLAGRGPSGESILPWLFPDDGSQQQEPDVMALAFQEVVPLTPQQILMTDPDKLRVWEAVINDTLRRRGGKSQYVILRSEQLVGTALIVLVNESIISHVKAVEASSKKTGLKGMSGNKGGVAIRLSIYDTTFCFVTAHFAAGKSNVEERNADYWTINRELGFSRARTVNHHDHVIWLGDFNYRIDSGNEVVRPMCDRYDFEGLYARDQLSRSRQMNQVFVGFNEAPIGFLPTYKYDFHSDRYDSSEKLRVPAWTDRILYRAMAPMQLALQVYDRAELKTSDHRPVYARFAAEARVFDQERHNAIRKELIAARKTAQARRGYLASSPSSSPIDRSEDEEAAEDDELDEDEWEDEELPEPSSDQSKWWDVGSPSSLSESEDEDEEEEIENVKNGEAGEARGNPFTAGHASPLRSRGGSGTIKRRPPPQPPKKLNSNSSSGAHTTSPGVRVSDENGSTEAALRRAAGSPLQSVSSPMSEAVSPSDPATSPVLVRAPPPIPSKPAHIQSANNAATATPALPKRPALGSRSASYTSQRSAKSLLDDSDSDSDERRSGRAMM